MASNGGAGSPLAPPLRVLNISYGADMGGVAWGVAQAFRRHPQPGVTVHSTVRKTRYLAYPADLPWHLAERYYGTADVVHLNRSAKSFGLLGPPKPFVMHHHGTALRENPEAYAEFMADPPAPGVDVVSTLDLLAYREGSVWCPSPFDLDMLATYRAPVTSRRLRVGHAPTDRAIKDTDAFLVACRAADVEPVLIERQSWDQCLTAKGTVDVFYDQVQLGYGNNAIEAWGMGIPVIAGATDSTLDLMRETFGALPFMTATVATITDALVAMKDPDIRAHWSDVGLAHARKWHDGRHTVDVLSKAYRKVLSRA